jgi:D-glycero-D-manno-heptose 1,7-bisphosphate phosphatase
MTAAARRRFVFLDRDGTLVRDIGYVHRVQDYALLPGVVPGLLRLKGAGFTLAILTNQSGIGRGLFTQAEFEAFQRQLLADLARQGVAIEHTLHCPHRPEDGCGCRKPAPGLLWRARDALGADLARSWLVGDAERDVQAARNAACAGAVRIAAKHAAPVIAGVPTARDLVEAAEIILATTDRP